MMRETGSLKQSGRKKSWNEHPGSPRFPKGKILRCYPQGRSYILASIIASTISLLRDDIERFHRLALVRKSKSFPSKLGDLRYDDFLVESLARYSGPKGIGINFAKLNIIIQVERSLWWSTSTSQGLRLVRA